METIDISYHLGLPDGRDERFDVCLHPQTLLPVEPHSGELPDWTRLDWQQCPHCPWSVQDHPHCPVALRLIPVVSRLGGVRSYDELALEVTFEQRTLAAVTSAQEGISSLVGLLIATSGCPHTEFLKPMARFHLPLSSAEETLYRVVSMYAMSCLLRMRKGQSFAADFDDLIHRYQAMRIVNRFVADRLKLVDEEGSTVNGIILLDYTAQLVPVSLNEEIEELENLFHGYLRDPGPKPR
jgi:hypothetical protein